MPASKPIGSALEKSIPHSDGPIRAINTGDMCRLFGLYGNPAIDAPLEELADFVRTYWSYSPTMGRKRRFFSVELAMLNYLKDEEEGSVSEGIAEGLKNLGDEFMDRNVLALMGVKDYPALIERYTRLKESGQDIGIESAFVGANLHIRRMVAHGLVVTEHQDRSRAGAIISKAKSVDFAITKKGHALIYLLDEFYEFNMIRNTKDFLLDGEQSIVFNGMAY